MATIQEEVGAWGARTAAWLADPDVCLTLEVEIAGDVPGVYSQKAEAVLGKGPAIGAYNASMIPNQKLKEFIIEVAKKTIFHINLPPRRVAEKMQERFIWSEQVAQLLSWAFQQGIFIPMSGSFA